MSYGALKHVAIQAFLIKHYVRLYHAAAAASRHGIHIHYILGGIEFAAIHAVVSVYAAVELIYVFAAGPGVQAVDILGNHRCKLALALQLGKGQMGGIGLYVCHKQRASVILEEALGVPHEEAMAQQRLRTFAETAYSVVYAVFAAKIRYSGFRAHPRAAKEHYAAGGFCHIPQCFDIIFHLSHSHAQKASPA